MLERKDASHGHEKEVYHTGLSQLAPLIRESITQIHEDNETLPKPAKKKNLWQ